MKDKIKKELTEKSKSVYHDYGHFAIEFEQLTLSIKVGILTLFRIQGLSDPKYLRVILFDQTTSPLASKYRSLVSLYFEKEPEKIKILEQLFTNTTKIIEKRNQIIHGSAFVNAELSELDFFKDKTGKIGVAMSEEKFDQTKFIELTTKVILAKQSFDMLNLHFSKPDDIFFIRFFNKFHFEEFDIAK